MLTVCSALLCVFASTVHQISFTHILLYSLWFYLLHLSLVVVVLLQEPGVREWFTSNENTLRCKQLMFPISLQLLQKCLKCWTPVAALRAHSQVQKYIIRKRTCMLSNFSGWTQGGNNRDTTFLPLNVLFLFIVFSNSGSQMSESWGKVKQRLLNGSRNHSAGCLFWCRVHPRSAKREESCNNCLSSATFEASFTWIPPSALFLR